MEHDRHDVEEFEISRHHREMEKMELLMNLEEARRAPAARRGPPPATTKHIACRPPPSTPSRAAFTAAVHGDHPRGFNFTQRHCR